MTKTMWIESIGLLAGFLTTVCFVPQVVKAWRTRSTTDLSLWMILILLTGVLLWLGYGLVIDNLPITLTNFFTAILIFMLLFFKIRNK